MYVCVPLQDSVLFIEQHKSGFERPGDVEFEDYSQGIKPATSDSSLNPPKVRAKLWPFSKKHKVQLKRNHLHLFEFAHSVSRARHPLPLPSLLFLHSPACDNLNILSVLFSTLTSTRQNDPVISYPHIMFCSLA